MSSSYERSGVEQNVTKHTTTLNIDPPLATIIAGIEMNGAMKSDQNVSVKKGIAIKVPGFARPAVFTSSWRPFILSTLLALS